jgi:hypothetical protein
MTPIRLGGRRSKYGAVRQDEDGYKFDSTAERNRYRDLKLMEVAAEISSLQVHPKFLLAIPRLQEGKKMQVKICDYIADFSYFDSWGMFVVEDVKSPATMTSTFRLKSKLLAVTMGIHVKCVNAQGIEYAKGNRKKRKEKMP